MAILVTGGAGYIGFHTCVELFQEGYEVIVVGNLMNGNEESLAEIFNDNNITNGYKYINK